MCKQKGMEGEGQSEHMLCDLPVCVSCFLLFFVITECLLTDMQFNACRELHKHVGGYKVNSLQCSVSTLCSFVDKFKPRNERMRDGPSVRYTNLYVKNFGEDFDEEQMKELFLPFGVINSLVVMKDDTGRSKGFGFVSYESHESASRAVEELNGKPVGDREIFVGRAMKKSERNAFLKRQFDAKRKERQQRFQGVNLYIKNLEEEIDDAQLREEFNKFGTITSAKVCVVVVGGGE